MMAIEGAVVTIDAMGCQRDIAQKIIDKKADYILALKGNQGTLREDVELFVDEQKPLTSRTPRSAATKPSMPTTAASKPANITVIHDVEWLQERHQWPGLKGVVMVESTREIGGKIDHETRFYITSLVLLANLIGPLIRGHWAIENSLHWVHGHGLSRRRMPRANRPRPRQFHHHQAHGHNLIRKAPRPRIPAPQAKSRRLGRRIPRQPHRRIDSFTRFPCGEPDSS